MIERCVLLAMIDLFSEDGVIRMQPGFAAAGAPAKRSSLSSYAPGVMFFWQ
jgi:hypothetical protein